MKGDHPSLNEKSVIDIEIGILHHGLMAESLGRTEKRVTIVCMHTPFPQLPSLFLLLSSRSSIPLFLSLKSLSFSSTLSVAYSNACTFGAVGFQGLAAVHPEYAHKFIIEYYSLKRQWYHLNMKRRSLVNGSAVARHPVGI